METVSFVFGIMGFVFGLSAFANATTASSKIAALEQRLKDAGVFEGEDSAETNASG